LWFVDGGDNEVSKLLRIIPAALLAGSLSTGPALAAGDYFVQLASVKSDQSARQEWVRLQKVHAGLLDDLTLDVQRADLGDRGIFFRIRTGPFPNRATAQDMCAQIKAADLGCLVVRDK
jgi:cell division septation protein DedD